MIKRKRINIQRIFEEIKHFTIIALIVIFVSGIESIVDTLFQYIGI